MIKLIYNLDFFQYIINIISVIFILFLLLKKETEALLKDTLKASYTREFADLLYSHPYIKIKIFYFLFPYIGKNGYFYIIKQILKITTQTKYFN